MYGLDAVMDPYLCKYRFSTSQNCQVRIYTSLISPTNIQMKGTSHQRTPRAPVLGVGHSLGAGDSYLVTNLLPPDLADVAFERLKTEVQWQTMYHRGTISHL